MCDVRRWGKTGSGQRWDEPTRLARSGQCEANPAYTVGFERGEVSTDVNAPTSMTIRVTHINRRIEG